MFLLASVRYDFTALLGDFFFGEDITFAPGFVFILLDTIGNYNDLILFRQLWLKRGQNSRN
jgi:hypothetical protein